MERPNFLKYFSIIFILFIFPMLSYGNLPQIITRKQSKFPSKSHEFDDSVFAIKTTQKKLIHSDLNLKKIEHQNPNQENIPSNKLTYFQTMVAGALSRTLAQTMMHPANTYKTMLQVKRTQGMPKLPPITFRRLLQGADAQFLLSLPHGAFHFFVTDKINLHLSKYLPAQASFFSDFLSSALSTIACSLVSTPQMVLTDRLMVGVYPSFSVALKSILSQDGVAGLYAGWWPALAQKIPSYGLTWMFFQQFKRLHQTYISKLSSTSSSTSSPSSSPQTQLPPHPMVNFFLGALAAALSVLCLIPLDTIKTRLVVQTSSSSSLPYLGMVDCFLRVLREEGIWTFYRSLPPRLLSVVPMIAIQYGSFEALKTWMLNHNQKKNQLLPLASLTDNRLSHPEPEQKQETQMNLIHQVLVQNINPNPVQIQNQVMTLEIHTNKNKHKNSKTQIQNQNFIERIPHSDPSLAHYASRQHHATTIHGRSPPSHSLYRPLSSISPPPSPLSSFNFKSMSNDEGNYAQSEMSERRRRRGVGEER